jgi:fido (protein-threonine AMPylation protein)
MEKHIRESNLIEGVDDTAQDRQSMTAWKWLIDQRQLNAAVVKRLHKILTQTQKDLDPKYKGVFRPIQVYVGSHVPPKPADIKREMSKWLKDYRILTPKEAHVQFETIHPFVDGNGRVGRMLMWWQERKLGRDATLIKASERWQYYAWFRGRGQPYEQTDILSALLPTSQEAK